MRREKDRGWKRPDWNKGKRRYKGSFRKKEKIWRRRKKGRRGRRRKEDKEGERRQGEGSKNREESKQERWKHGRQGR